MAYPQPPPPPPPLPEPEPEIKIDTGRPATGRGSLRSRVAGEYRRAKKSATKLPKFFLLAATIIWPIAAAGWGQVRYSWEMAEAKHFSADEYLVPYGSETRLQSGQTVRWRASLARWAGMTHVTIIYGVAVAGCLAWWFYVKD